MTRIGGRTRLYCVLGHPVGHSLSPAMHNAALAAMGEDAVYTAFDVLPSELPAAVSGLRALGVSGANATIPHKEQLVTLVDELSPRASLIGAVNTLAFRDGRVVGENTDGCGFLAALEESGVTVDRSTRAVVLGAGGSARAVVMSLAQAGANVVIANRTEERARQLAADLHRAVPGCGASVVPLHPPALVGPLSGANLLVNTTSAGMSGAETAELIPAGSLHPGLFVFDLVYSPPETPLLAAARRAGCSAANGLGMLVHQAAFALRFWLSKEPPVDLMRARALEALGGEA